ncbi:DUF1127 domain-containing protein [Variovorax sp. LT2P21]|uniref:DUF1127 domain-containing protein n=1 Tax=Variovorax sp. LT2P21 TaxID=3443731 RepID=UPI003F46914D
MTRTHPTASATLLATLRRWLGRVCGIGGASADALELRGMSDHELSDLGIGRSEIQEWSRRSEPTDRHGTRERAPLHGHADRRLDSARAGAEQRQHDGLERLGFRLVAGGQGAGLRGRQPGPVDHVVLGMERRAQVNV